MNDYRLQMQGYFKYKQLIARLRADTRLQICTATTSAVKAVQASGQKFLAINPLLFTGPDEALDEYRPLIKELE